MNIAIITSDARITRWISLRVNNFNYKIIYNCINCKIYRSIVKDFIDDSWLFQATQSCPRMSVCTFADNEPIGNTYYFNASPGIRAVHCRSLSCRNQRDSTERQMTLSAFILLPTFMCISRHDRRDNRARCIIVNVSQFLLLRVVLASALSIKQFTIAYGFYLFEGNKFIYPSMPTDFCMKNFCNTVGSVIQSLQYN